MSQAYFTLLSEQGVLSVKGSDAKKFLQGQITCNLDYVHDNRSSLGARCNPKGRMISNFRVLQVAEGYLLAMDHSLVDLQIEELKKYALFSKSSLSNVSAEWARFGLVDAEAILQALGLELPYESNSVVHLNHLTAVRVSPSLIELWCPADEASCLTKRLISHGATESDTNIWHLGLISAGIAYITEATSDSFIPQIFNLPALDAVSFKKGCYSGQEIVARMQYLGKLKRHLFRFALNSEDLPAAGTQVFSVDKNNAIGEVIIAALNPAESVVELLAVALEESTLQGSVRLGAIDGPELLLLPLPYANNPEEEIKR